MVFSGRWGLEVIFLLCAFRILWNNIDSKWCYQKKDLWTCGVEELGVSRPKGNMRARDPGNSMWCWSAASFLPYSHQALSTDHGYYAFVVQIMSLFWSSQLFEAIIAFSLPIRGLTWPIPLDRDRKDYAFDPSFRSHTLLFCNLTFYIIAQSGNLPSPHLTPSANANMNNQQEPGCLIMFSLQAMLFLMTWESFILSFAATDSFKTSCFQQWSTHIFKKDFIYLFLERGEGKEKERERNINVWLLLVHPLLGT